jgi:pyruvate,water dikinase
LSDDEAAHIASLILRIEDRLNVPQDIEWAMDQDGTVMILQCRPLAGNAKQTVDTSIGPEPPSSAPAVLSGGVTVSPGTAAGTVYIAWTEVDIAACPDDAVVVLTHPLPIFATLITRVQAVVSERGGIAGHLASVCRQFDVPSLFSVKNASSILRNHQTVTVDADGKQVLEGHVARVAERQRKSVMFHGSRVFQALEEIASKIIPLNLLDPDATEFKPANCLTYHDITRFCHEKAVREMFEFGVKEPFPGHVSKQLLVEQPMQFWLIDLDDGFELADPGSPYVRLEEIRSIPMLALWRGMTAVPWKGPPPVNPKGFMEVLFGSMSDPSLVPSMPSGYATRNHFMISKHFMSLQSRFGYHYSTVETLVSNRAMENYASFNFKGGAAGLERRTRRAKMIEEILKDEGFRVKRYGDGVRARIEGIEKTQMIKRIATLGFLLMHTRQLDMAMSDEASVKKYKAAILAKLGVLREMEAETGIDSPRGE